MTELPAPAPRRLGPDGPQVSPIAWGMWRFQGDDTARARALIEAALDAGVTLFDTADIYGPDNGEAFGAAEALLGRVFAEAPRLRERLVLATKGGIVIGTPYDSSAAYLAAAIDASLRRLGTERVELWQIHRPDILTHPHEVAEALMAAHRSGKIGAIGVSNFTAPQVSALQRFLPVPIAVHQIELSPVHVAPFENGLSDQAIAMGMAVLAWSPLGGGRLGAPGDERARAVAQALDAKAGEAGVSRAAVAYSWIMAHPSGAIPIVGTQQPERIREIPSALTVRWTRAEWYAVLVAARGERLP
ncbi:MAG: aldo/keto reductase [Sphingomonadaceae bacterium]|nr:aldo/keto reductase [Sphingomonadaceae bacterium]